MKNVTYIFCIGLKTAPTGSFGVQPQVTTSLIGSTTSFGQSLFNSTNTSNAFQLQKPPIGSKRKLKDHIYIS